MSFLSHAVQVIPEMAQQAGTAAGKFIMTLTPEWATIIVTILIAILGSVLGQLKASWDMRSDLRVGITKIEALERKVDDHEERLRDVEKGKKP